VNIRAKISSNFKASVVTKAYRKETIDLVNDVATGTQSLLKKTLNRGDGRTNPSKPGQPPHVRTGTLRRSWTTKTNRTEKRSKSGVRLRLGSNVKYARALEFGYRPRNLAARPYLGPTVRSPQLRKFIDQRLAASAKKIRSTIQQKAVKR
jgi:hypothetical protein